MHLLNSPLASHPPAKYPFTLLPPCNRPPSQLLRLRCASAAPVAAGQMTFYELLGIPETVTLPEIKKAYKQLACKYHPDVSPPDWVEENTHRFILLQQAYETLSDPTRRALYDQQAEDRSQWRNKWQSQLSELKRRRDHHATANSSWGAQMRSGHSQPSSEP